MTFTFSLLFFGITLHAASGIFQTYVILDENGGGNAYYAGGINSDGATSFNGLDFGTPTSFILKGGEVKTFKNDGSDVTGAQIFYRVFKQGGTVPNFTGLNLPFDSNLGSNGDQKWDEIAENIDVLALATDGNGTYVLEVFWEAFSSDGSHFDSDGGNNFEATFTVAVMPVAWQAIKIATQGVNHHLSFAIATETNNSHFDIQRSTDSRSWTSIGQVKGAGTTTNTQEYTYIDKRPFLGQNYYRVKQIDYDGTFSYSAVVSAKFEPNDGDISIYPNPSKGQIFLAGDLQSAGAPTVQILTINGRLLRELPYTSAGVDTSQLSTGLYLVRVVVEDRIAVQQRLIIE